MERKMRNLSSQEIEMVGGGTDSTYMNGTTTVTEHYDSNNNWLSVTYVNSDGSGSYFDGSTYSRWSAPDFGIGDYFACIGISSYAAGGFCYSDGHLYSYVGGSVGPSPVDLTFGTSADADAFLEGWSVAGNGLPGAGVSFNDDGTVAATAWVTGTPGGSITYGVDLNDLATRVGSMLSDGFYNWADRPYDPEPQFYPEN
jgi:hypothetical protein